MKGRWANGVRTSRSSIGSPTSSSSFLVPFLLQILLISPFLFVSLLFPSFITTRGAWREHESVGDKKTGLLVEVMLDHGYTV